MKKPVAFGDFACTYNLKSQWIYKTLTPCSGFFIRKTKWKALFKDHEIISLELHAAVKRKYLYFIHMPMMYERMNVHEKT